MEGPSEAPPPGATNLVAPVTISSPANNTVSNSNQITISGSCLATTTVTLAGSAQSSVGCSNRAFSFNVTKTTDGLHTFYVSQGFSSTRVSAPVSVAWTRDTIASSAPTVTIPTNNPAYSNSNTLQISGACESGATVALSGQSTGTTSCVNSAYSFTVSKTSDATYAFGIQQTDRAGNTSQSSTVQWIRDTVVPSAPTVTSPGSSAEESVTVSGTCEPQALVRLSGAESDSVNCLDSGQFDFTLTQSIAGTYSYSVDQVDRAGNVSGSTSFSWTYDATVPSTPVIQSPASSPVYSSDSSLSISGLCTDGMTVYLTRTGDSPVSTSCSSGAFSFTVSKSVDGTYSFNVYQNSGANVDSAAASVTWVRDTVAPGALVLTQPTAATTYSNSNAFAFAGTCESGAEIVVSGPVTVSAPCSSGAFSVSVSRTVDSTYNFSILQKDRAGNSSTSLSRTWIRDTVAPSAITLTSHGSSHASNANSVTLAGTCEESATVAMSGASTGSATCSGGTFSLPISKTTDGSYSVNLVQTDRAGNASGALAFTWTRDAAAPSAPVIENPAAASVTSSGSTLILSGSCETGATVDVTGDDTDSTTCANGAFSLTVDEMSDGTYTYSVSQTDAAGNTSASTSRQWVRSSAVPATPVLTSPSTSPYISNGNTLVISGSCVSGNTVEMSGDSVQSMACSGGNTFSFSISKTLDGTSNYSVLQRSASNIPSASVAVSWIRDTVAPDVPSMSEPVVSQTNTYYSNTNTLSIRGTCETNATVSISGGATASASCTAGSYTISITKTADSSYSLLIRQTDLAGNISGSRSLTWVRDTVRPNQVTITSPALNPYASGDSSISVTGTCEAGAATVTMSGESAGTQSCSTAGQFTFTVSKSVDGNYNYAFVQTDLAGNISLSQSFTWTRDTSVPSTPVISVPSASPYYSNGNSITITASCQTGLSPLPAVLNISGDISESEVSSPAGSLSQDCNVSPKTFVVQKSVDGSYTFYLDQENRNNSLGSASSSITWIRDTVAASAPTITTPSVSPFTSPGNLTISGACESNATVTLSGDSTQSVICTVPGSYTFNVVKSTDATYSFQVRQTDRAGNTSTARSLSWIRNTNAVQPPEITTPAVSPIVSNDSTVTIAGSCTTDYTVLVSGDIVSSDVVSPANSLSQLCVGSTFSFVISKSTDSTYTFNLKQRFNGIDSADVDLIWTRDTVAPVVTFTSTPPATNFVVNASFAFTSNEANSTFICSLDSATFASCSSPVNFSNMDNDGHVFSVRAVDKAGNVGTASSWNWTQAGYNTLALYHFDSSDPTEDSSDFTQEAGFNNNLTASGSLSNFTSGFFGTSRTFTTSSQYTAVHNDSLNLGRQTMTVEGFFRLASTPSYGTYYTIVSKSAASPNLGWEVRVRRSSSSSRCALQFYGSLNGTSGSTATSSYVTLNTNTWYYFAVTWSRGSVVLRIFNNGSSLVNTSRTIGTVGSSTLFGTTANLRIGAAYNSSTTSTPRWFNGQIDEVRISQTVRTIRYPTSEFEPD